MVINAFVDWIMLQYGMMEEKNKNMYEVMDVLFLDVQRFFLFLLVFTRVSSFSRLLMNEYTEYWLMLSLLSSSIYALEMSLLGSSMSSTHLLWILTKLMKF